MDNPYGIFFLFCMVMVLFCENFLKLRATITFTLNIEKFGVELNKIINERITLYYKTAKTISTFGHNA